MEERVHDDGFEATFVVATPRHEAWERLRNAKPAFDALGSARPGQWWIPAIEAPADELEIEPESLLRARKAVEPCKNTEIVIRLEDEGTGTRITIVQTGFGDGFAEQAAWLATGWYAILADFVAFFQRGVSLGRHATWWSSLGCDVAEVDEGLLVTAVHGGRFADQAGLRNGDLVLQLMGAPVITIRDLSILLRGPFKTGTEQKVRYLRGDEVLTGAGVV